ncbi:MAG: RnfABCDGE type electron transport complex subunit D [Candidatus Cloacimonetes bacterium]|nr:RnfABCDGE type electron transport complex subunit D [Candidatus Cloacimonadota bacterium]
MLKFFMKQKNMQRMLLALLPIIFFSIFLFGWRIFLIIIITNLVAVFTEYLFIRQRKNGKISQAVFVTGTLLALSLPPTIPFWMASVGAIVAVTFGKMVFGGFGMNVFNPAMVGRTSIYVSFANAMTVRWLKPFTSFPGGFATYLKPAHLTSATPITVLRDSGISTKFSDLFFGTISGSIGETSALLVIIATIYLIFTKTAKWQVMLSTILSFTAFILIFYRSNPLPYILSGGLLFGVVFIATDPVSMPKNKTAVWIFGGLVGFLTVFIRKFSLFAEGFMFSIILANTFMPIIEYTLNKSKQKGKK